MPNLISLHRLQQADQRLEEISGELSSLNLQAKEKEIQEKEKLLQIFREQTRNEERLLKDAELELATLESEKKRVREKLFGGKTANPKELSQLEKELQNLEKRREKLDEKVLLCMDKVTRMEIESKEREAAFSEIRRQLEEEKKTKAERKQSLGKQVEEMEKIRNGLMESLENDLLGLYQTLKERKGGLAVAKIQKNSCSGCFMLVPESTIQKVRALEVEFCSSCGRILYFDKEP